VRGFLLSAGLLCDGRHHQHFASLFQSFGAELLVDEFSNRDDQAWRAPSITGLLPPTTYKRCLPGHSPRLQLRELNDFEILRVEVRGLPELQPDAVSLAWLNLDARQVSFSAGAPRRQSPLPLDEEQNAWVVASTAWNDDEVRWFRHPLGPAQPPACPSVDH
jgi:hypothetical protein